MLFVILLVLTSLIHLFVAWMTKGKTVQVLYVGMSISYAICAAFRLYSIYWM